MDSGNPHNDLNPFTDFFENILPYVATTLVMIFFFIILLCGVSRCCKYITKELKKQFSPHAENVEPGQVDHQTLKDVRGKLQLLAAALSSSPNEAYPEVTSSRGRSSVQTSLQLACGKQYFLDQKMFDLTEEDVLGEGAFGKVYKGVYSTQNGQRVDVAIKKTHLPSNKIKVKTLRVSFIREVTTYKKLGNRCDNIVQFYGASCDQANLFLITQLCHNGSLETFLETKLRPVYYPTATEEGIQALPMSQDYFVSVVSTSFINITPEILQQLVNWCAQIANGMAFLTQENMLHVDLATRNVLLTQNNTAKICDFGLSRKCGTREYLAKSLMKGGFPLNSLAPEWNAVIDMDTPKPLTRFMDIWAYGCTLWQIFTLNDPLYCEPGAEVGPEQRFLHAHTFLKQKKRLSRPKYATDFVWEKIHECWNETPESRPEFLDLKHDFGNYLNELKQ